MKVAVASGKGGTGKTLLSASLFSVSIIFCRLGDCGFRHFGFVPTRSRP